MTDPTSWHIDPEAPKFVELGRPRPEGYTAHEFDELARRTTCPACGTVIDIKRVYTGARGDPEPYFIPGRWRCPQGCIGRPPR